MTVITVALTSSAQPRKAPTARDTIIEHLVTLKNKSMSAYETDLLSWAIEHVPSMPKVECYIGYPLTLSENEVLWCTKIIIRAPVKILDGHILVLWSDKFTDTYGGYLDGRGTAGIKGDDGSQPLNWTSRTGDDFWAARRDCLSGSNGGLDKGGRGGDGGRGGHGAVVVSNRQVNMRVVVAGGPGGKGGRGGPGRLLKNGESSYCDGCQVTCPQGDPGKDGENGDDGRLIIVDHN